MFLFYTLSRTNNDSNWFTGAFGYFEVTHDISQYSKAAVFSQVGKKTPIAIRFSTVGGESGSADTVRDPRGFAVKFYTEEGNWDLVGNNTPIFFIRDPILFPSFIHTQKRNPATHLKVFCSKYYLQAICRYQFFILWILGCRYVLGFYHIETRNDPSGVLLVFWSWHSRWLPFHEWIWITYFQNG